MDKDLIVGLNRFKNVESTDLDIRDKLVLKNTVNLIEEPVGVGVVNSYDVFENERNELMNYRFYGGLLFDSMLNGVRNNFLVNDKTYGELKDFLFPSFNDMPKTILNSFDFYLVIPANDEYISIVPTPGTTTPRFLRKFKVIAKPNDFNINIAGFSINKFNQPTYSFVINNDYNFNDVVDWFGFPITDVYLYAQYKPKRTIINNTTYFEEYYWLEYTFSGNNWNSYGITPPTYDYGDVIDDGDIVTYFENEYEYIVNESPKHRILTSIKHNEIIKQLRWVYNPLTKINIMNLNNVVTRYLIDDIFFVENQRPYYAKEKDGYYYWRNIISEGDIDIIDGSGRNIPFMNGFRYVFENIKITVKPDMTHNDTNTILTNIKFGAPEIISVVPDTELNDFGKPCK